MKRKALVAPTERDTILRDGPANLYRFVRSAPASSAVPVVLVPSPINRWYVMDLREGVSLARSLLDQGFDVWCLDWGISDDEDRYLTWDELLERLGRAVRRVRRETQATGVSLLGYCLGGTLSGIHTALEPVHVRNLINLAGPYDFSRSGILGRLTDRRWFAPDVIGAAGNLPASQMQSAFVALRPTIQLAKWVNLLHRADDPQMRTAFAALETWANDNVPFPGAAYARYIEALYQDNELVRGEHRVGGRRVDLGEIRCPVLTIAAERDHICPVDAARGLHDHCASPDRELLVVPGGHVGAVVGSSAPRKLYPAIGRWLSERA